MWKWCELETGTYDSSHHAQRISVHLPEKDCCLIENENAIRLCLHSFEICLGGWAGQCQMGIFY